MKNIELENQYVITALKDGDRVFLAVDPHSGGHPYWATYPRNKYDNLSDVMFYYNRDYVSGPVYMKNEVYEVTVAKVETTLIPVDIDSDEIIRQRREEALSKLSEEDRKLLGL